MLHTEALTAATLAYQGLNHAALADTVLGTIINAKVADLSKIKAYAASLYPCSMHQVQSTEQHTNCATNFTPNKAQLTFSQSLNKEGRRFILECKRASPTLGDINLQLDIPTQVELYAHRAAAISVLTEEHFFKGSYEVLQQVRKLTTLPVLCKDFVICEEQIQIAASCGADAILLMFSVLTVERFTELYQYAHQLGLEVLAEVSTVEEAKIAATMQLEVVGINNRDLKTLQIDLQRSVSLAPYFNQAPTTILVSESGIKQHSDIEALAPLRCFLIGSVLCALPNLSSEDHLSANSLVKQNIKQSNATSCGKDIDKQTMQRKLGHHMDQILYGLNKICGNNSQAGIEAAIRNHVAISGLIFVPQSPRYITPAQATSLIAPYRRQIDFCGVFMDENLHTVVNIAQQLQLEYVQLHGQESLSYIQQLKQALPQVKLIKALKLNPQDADSFTQDKLIPYFNAKVDFILLDSASPGSGQCIKLAHLLKLTDRSRIILAGGLGADNLATVKQQLLDAVKQQLLSADKEQLFNDTEHATNQALSSNSLSEQGANLAHKAKATTEESANIYPDMSHLRAPKNFFIGFDLNSKLESAAGFKDPALIDATFSI